MDNSLVLCRNTWLRSLHGQVERGGVWGEGRRGRVGRMVGRNEAEARHRATSSKRRHGALVFVLFCRSFRHSVYLFVAAIQGARTIVPSHERASKQCCPDHHIYPPGLHITRNHAGAPTVIVSRRHTQGRAKEPVSCEAQVRFDKRSDCGTDPSRPKAKQVSHTHNTRDK